MVTFNDMKVQQIVDDPTLSTEDKIKLLRGYEFGSACAAARRFREPDERQ